MEGLYITYAEVACQLALSEGVAVRKRLAAPARPFLRIGDRQSSAFRCPIILSRRGGRPRRRNGSRSEHSVAETDTHAPRPVPSCPVPDLALPGRIAGLGPNFRPDPARRRTRPADRTCAPDAGTAAHARRDGGQSSIVLSCPPAAGFPVCRGLAYVGAACAAGQAPPPNL